LLSLFEGSTAMGSDSWGWEDGEREVGIGTLRSGVVAVMYDATAGGRKLCLVESECHLSMREAHRLIYRLWPLCTEASCPPSVWFWRLHHPVLVPWVVNCEFLILLFSVGTFFYIAKYLILNGRTGHSSILVLGFRSLRLCYALFDSFLWCHTSCWIFKIRWKSSLKPSTFVFRFGCMLLW
jgi:hypothetical protein